MVVYIVMGRTGEYSARDDWSVTAYFDKTLAEQHVQLASAYAKQVEAATERYSVERHHIASPYDPRFHMDYTGTWYYVLEVSVTTAVPVAA